MSLTHTIAHRYIIENPQTALLGQGGMGAVYRAVDSQTNTAVAIKVLKHDLSSNSQEMIDRFVREGETLSHLNHPNIVKLLNNIEDKEENNTRYLVMEYVEGGSLRDLMDQRKALPIKQALRIALELADALAHAHHLNIIHRDLKPANVLLTAAGSPRLTDFGVAHMLGNARLTATGMLVGTLDYLSPEACSGQVLDARSDIWSFGVLLYEMLVGERPFKGATPAGTLAAIISQPMPDPLDKQPELPDMVVDLLYRMLEKERGQRIPTMRLIAAELELVLESLHSGDTSTSSMRALGNMQRGSSSGSAVTNTPSTPSRRHNLPTTPMAIIGREVEISALAKLFEQGRLVTILGPGGMGKTRLSIAVGEMSLGRFEHGVYFVPLAPLTEASYIPEAIAEAVNLPLRGNQTAEDQLVNYLRSKQMLLILDNFEHLMEGVGLVGRILQAAADVKILVTTRERLKLAEEQLYPLQGLAFPEWETPANARNYAAVQLFEMSARRVSPGYELAAGDLPHLTRICRLVEGMPLGIVLAAAWVEMLSPAEIAAELGRSVDFLETDMRDIPERQRSMHAVFDYSWRLLDPAEQEAFKQLSIFRGGFSREAAQQVTGASLRTLMNLVNKSLLYRAPTGRYQVHELLRQYADQQLRLNPAVYHTGRSKHAQYYLSLLSEQGELMKGPKQKEALDLVEAEIDNIRFAWFWAVEQQDWEGLAQSLEGLFVYTETRTVKTFLDDLIDSALAELAKLPAPHPPLANLLEAHLIVLQGWVVLVEMFNTNLPLEQIDRVYQLLQQAGSYPPSLFTILLAYITGWHHGRLEEAITFGQAEIGRLRAQNNKWAVSIGLRWLAGLVDSAGRYPEAKAMLEESIALGREINDQLHLAHSFMTLGSTSRRQDNLLLAKQAAQESRILFQAAGDKVGAAEVYWELATIEELQGNYQQALELFKSGQTWYEESGQRLYAAEASSWEAVLLTRMGELDQAHAIRQRLYSSLEELNAPEEWVWNCFEDGEIYRVEGNYDKAQERYETAWQRANQLPSRTGFASYHHALGMLAYHREQYAKAQEYFSVGFNYIITHPRANALSWYSARDGLMLSLVGVRVGDIPLAKSYFEQSLTYVYRVPNSGLRGLAAVVKAEIGLAEGDVEAAVAILKYAQQYRPMWYETKQELQQLWNKVVATYGVEQVKAIPSLPAGTDIKEILNKSGG